MKSTLSALIICFLLFSLGCEPRVANRDSKGTNIICFGNSITKGTGSSEGNDYPSLLSKKLNREVINAGVEGDTTEEGLQRIETDVLERNPRLVIIELSGNDFLQGLAVQTTLENLNKMMLMIQQKQAMIVLVEVAAGTLGDRYLSGFKQLAKKRKALLIPNILKGIFYNPSLKSDEIHPNDVGYDLIADRIYKKIMPLLK